MIRKYFHKLKKSEKDNIRWRSHEPVRIEAVSDGVFAFAVSLLIISLEVPKSSEELLRSLRGFIPFIFCFTFLALTWYMQFKFFRRYGMHDFLTILLNGILLFVVLFYVFPLKFMASAAASGGREYVIRPEDAVALFNVYNGGFMAIFLLFCLMYCNAFLKRDETGLTPPEVFETKSFIYVYLYSGGVGGLALLLGSLGTPFLPLSGMCYGLMGGTGIIGAVRGIKFKKKFGSIKITEPHHGTEA